MTDPDFMQVPTLTKEEVNTFLQELEDFEIPEGQQEEIEKHREALREEN